MVLGVVGLFHGVRMTRYAVFVNTGCAVISSKGLRNITPNRNWPNSLAYSWAHNNSPYFFSIDNLLGAWDS